MRIGHIGSAAWSKKWVFALSDGVCPGVGRIGQRYLLELRWFCNLHTTVVQGLLAGGSVVALWLKTFAMTDEVGRNALLAGACNICILMMSPIKLT